MMFLQGPFVELTTGAGCFAEASRTLGKAASAKIRSAKPSLSKVVYRALRNEKTPLTARCR
jgi:hypothetical protein